MTCADVFTAYGDLMVDSIDLLVHIAILSSVVQNYMCIIVSQNTFFPKCVDS
jgi:hypothetical protein